MHSKWKLWDYFSTHKSSLNINEKGIYVFRVFEPIITTFVKKNFPREFQYENPKIEIGQELTRSALEEITTSLSLFGTSQPLIVLNAEDLSKECSDFLVENHEKIQDRFVILFFEADSSLYKNLIKTKEVKIVEIEAPYFWEYNKVFDFLCEQRKMNFSYEAKNYFLEIIPQTVLDFVNAIDIVNLNKNGDERIEKKEIEKSFAQLRIDQFKLASLLSEKKKKNFYEELINLKMTYDESRAIFFFLQGHMIRLADPSYIKKKNRPSKYDKEIQSYSVKWKAFQIEEQLSKFCRWEILSKRKDKNLYLELKQAYFNESYPL